MEMEKKTSETLIGCERMSEFASDVGLRFMLCKHFAIFDLFAFGLSCWWAIIMIRDSRCSIIRSPNYRSLLNTSEPIYL